jgi:hypothetical protein
MLNRACFWRLFGLILLALSATTAAWADTLISVTSPSAQGANDFVRWSQLGPDATLVGVSFSAPSVALLPVTVTLAGANSVVSVVCVASPCSWKGSGFTAADSLLWTSDAGNSGNGPVTLSFATPITGAGAMIQSNAPGAFTAEIQAFNGATLLGSFTVNSPAGAAVYIGIQDQTGANITKVVFSLTACGPLDLSSCTDFAIDTVNLNVGPAVAFLSTHALAFGVQPIGATSTPGPAALLNVGGAFMPISSIATSGANSGDFSATPSSCANPLPPAAVCLLSVTFKPTGPGPRKSSISISDNAAGSPQTVVLTGVGTAASLSPTALPFAGQTVNTSSAAQTIILTNKGTVTMNLWQIAILGANAGDFSLSPPSTCGSTLGTGANCTVSVTFKPTATGARTASVLFSNDGGGSPQAVTLTGTGI